MIILKAKMDGQELIDQEWIHEGLYYSAEPSATDKDSFNVYWDGRNYELHKRDVKSLFHRHTSIKGNDLKVLSTPKDYDTFLREGAGFNQVFDFRLKKVIHIDNFSLSMARQLWVLLSDDTRKLLLDGGTTKKGTQVEPKNISQIFNILWTIYDKSSKKG